MKSITCDFCHREISKGEKTFIYYIQSTVPSSNTGLPASERNDTKEERSLRNAAEKVSAANQFDLCEKCLINKSSRELFLEAAMKTSLRRWHKWDTQGIPTLIEDEFFKITEANDGETIKIKKGR